MKFGMKMKIEKYQNKTEMGQSISFVSKYSLYVYTLQPELRICEKTLQYGVG